MQEDVPQPPASRPLSALQKVWADYGQGIATADDLMLVLNAVADLAQIEHGRLQEQAEQGVSDPQNPGYQLILEGFEQYLAAVEQMALEIEEPGQGHFEGGLKLAQEADHLLARGHQNVVRQIQDVSTILCMFCGGQNPRGSERCHRCGRNLPLQSGESREGSFSAVQAEGTTPPGDSGSAGPVTANYAHLARGVAAFKAEQVTGEELLAALEEVTGRLAAHQEANTQELAGLGEDAPEAVAEALRQTETLLADSLAALEKMKQAFEKDDDSYLELGLEDLREASQGLVSCYQVLQSQAPPPKPGPT